VNRKDVNEIQLASRYPPAWKSCWRRGQADDIGAFIGWRIRISDTESCIRVGMFHTTAAKFSRAMLGQARQLLVSRARRAHHPAFKRYHVELTIHPEFSCAICQRLLLQSRNDVN
jgi:hypothetical protein